MIAKNEVRLLPGALVEIRLTMGKVTIIDLADLPLVADYHWLAKQHRYTFYAIACRSRCGLVGPRIIRMHRIILGATAETDHINGDGLDNRRCNLRHATASQNRCNAKRRVDNTSGFKGVSWGARENRWLAKITLSGKSRSLGFFETAEEAAQAYDTAAAELHGEFARLNFPRRLH